MALFNKRKKAKRDDAEVEESIGAGGPDAVPVAVQQVVIAGRESPVGLAAARPAVPALKADGRQADVPRLDEPLEPSLMQIFDEEQAVDAGVSALAKLVEEVSAAELLEDLRALTDEVGMRRSP